MSALTASRRRAVHFLVGALLFAFVVRLCIGMLYTNYFDIRWYLTWARSLPDGFFNCYVRLTDGQYALDYPPVYLVVLYLVGWLYRFIPLERYEMFEMLVMKFFPILFDILAAMMLYLCCRRRGETFALLAACFWALNPSAVFNAACWGQTDGMMLFFLLLSFHTVESGRPILGSVLFAVAAWPKCRRCTSRRCCFCICCGGTNGRKPSSGWVLRWRPATARFCRSFSAAGPSAAR